MTAEKLYQLLEHPDQIGKEEIEELSEIINSYPYFQTVRFLHLKALQNTGSYRFNQQLRVTAAHASSRTKLFEYISTPDYPDRALEDYIEEAAIETQLEPNVELFEVETHLPDKALQIVDETVAEKEQAETRPLEFHPNERHSFNEWLNLLSAHPVQRLEKAPSTEKEEDLVVRFLEKEPTISRPSKEDIKLKPRVQESTEGYTPALMTETLARVYAEQGLYDKSINAYKILLLKYPEKNSFFAARISELQALKQNKQ